MCPTSAVSCGDFFPRPGSFQRLSASRVKGPLAGFDPLMHGRFSPSIEADLTTMAVYLAG
jgi:hypothetical protein